MHINNVWDGEREKVSVKLKQKKFWCADKGWAPQQLKGETKFPFMIFLFHSQFFTLGFIDSLIHFFLSLSLSLLFFVQFLFLPLFMRNASSNCMTFFFRSHLSLRLKMLSINRYMAQKNKAFGRESETWLQSMWFFWSNMTQVRSKISNKVEMKFIDEFRELASTQQITWNMSQSS
jgi:hypothetical protein